MTGKRCVEVGLIIDDEIGEALVEGQPPLVEVGSGIVLQDAHAGDTRLNTVEVDVEDRLGLLRLLSLTVLALLGGGARVDTILGLLGGLLSLELSLSSGDGRTKVPDLDATGLGGGVVEELGGLEDVLEDLVVNVAGELLEVVQLGTSEDHTEVSLTPDRLGAWTGHAVFVGVTFSVQVVDVVGLTVKLGIGGF